jgi:hypothetical protein
VQLTEQAYETALGLVRAPQRPKLIRG